MSGFFIKKEPDMINPIDRNKQKELEKQKLNKQIKEYLNKGGKISVMPTGAITDEGQMNYKFRRGKKKKPTNDKT